MDDRSIARGMKLNRHPLDDDSATRLLQGAVHPDDAPPGYGAVADLLAAAVSVPAIDEDAGADTISAMVAAIQASPAPQISGRRTMIGKLLAGKALVAVAVLGLGATGAAAATGALPDTVQGVVSDAVSHVGVDIPHPNHGKSANHRQDGKHDGSDDPAGDDQSGDEGKGMSDTVADLKNGRADDAGPLGQDVCVIASDGKCRSGDNHKGGEDETTPPDTSGENRGKSGDDHGRADDEHPTTPTTGSIDTGVEHSDGKGPSDKGRPDSDS